MLEHNCNIEVVERILLAGADLNARTEWGDTPAHYAAAYSRYEVLRYLIDKGCEVHKPNECKLLDIYIYRYYTYILEIFYVGK